MTKKESIGDIIEGFQRMEITEHIIYKHLATVVKDAENSRILSQMAVDELRHYDDWEKISKRKIKPNMWHVWKYILISRVFGFTFGIKLMERDEEKAQHNYSRLIGEIPGIEKWIQEEEIHEQKLLEMLDEERLRYAGSIVLGLNDALVELTGALAGLTLALQNVKLIALSGLIIGIAASLSMAASEYLSTRSENTDKIPTRAAFYTGIAYIITVMILVSPYLIFSNYILDLIITLSFGIIIIAVFNYYISVAKDQPFRERFVEMVILSLGIATFSFILGYFIRIWLDIEI
ncbi:MAG: VIT1/CCC1 transporter family protein [Anaerolineae bacterium]|nr:VIT1/CCC1 transporter family protein [Anaerolineae bacterium]MDK1081828.1 VIT1/CCC1 transporter family protein [Anaerolineae bacterium]MDK1119617.1 VIT1/CCC1 transporter family protein [Anaerolineae bacterium]